MEEFSRSEASSVPTPNSAALARSCATAKSENCSRGGRLWTRSGRTGGTDHAVRRIWITNNGSAGPLAPYTENRVHPQQGYGRPGWLRIMDYCHGMITGWAVITWTLPTGAWHGTVRSREIKAWAEYPNKASGMSTQIQDRLHLPHGVTLVCAGTDINKEGVVFRGTEGWIHVQRGEWETHPSH